MNGYLMQEQQWTPGEDLFLESFSPENHYGVVFEDDGETAYFYAVEKDDEGAGLRILDALHIRESGEVSAADGTDLKIIWSRDWLKCALVLDSFVHALFDFGNQSGYNINEFPPPNEFWTQGDRKLTPELIQQFFS
ncbi:MAG TPA: DUF2251 domain-containing protein [Puia sp.]|nr:DUF2251 domain-containing protein [Puia sp.]